MQLRFLLLCVALAGVSACSSLPLSEPRSALPAAFQDFLADAAPGSRVVLAESPWGPEVTVYAHHAYYAASGRTCRRLTIMQSGMRRPALVCRLPGGGWERVRALIRGGRSLLSPNNVPPNREGWR